MGSDDWSGETIPTPRAGRDGSPNPDSVGVPVGRTLPSAGVWLLGAAALVLALAVGGLWAVYLLRGQIATSGGPTPTPVIWTPTAAPVPTATPTPVPTVEISEPTPTVSPDIAIGRYVQVVGTGGYGLSLRSGPAENYTRMDIAREGEVFVIVDGPTVAGGSEWWKIQDRENAEREWWAVGNFLQPVEHP